MTLTELAQKVYNARSLPGELADLHITLASMYSTESEKMMELQLNKADYWLLKELQVTTPGGARINFVNYQELKEAMEESYLVDREKPLSDKQVEMMWLQTEEGKKEIKLKYTLRSLEKLMSAVKSSLVNATIESRNL